MRHSQLLAIVSILWVASEIALALVRRSRSGTAERKDRASYAVLVVSIIIGTAGGSMLRAVRSAAMPGGAATFYTGVALIFIGIAVRWIAILTLGRYFTVDVAISKDHRVVQHGVYGIVRHPSYSGALLSFIGLGIAYQNWLSLAAVVTMTLIGFSYRISVEEQALLSSLGDDYRAYAARTKRLVPGVF